MRLTVPEPKIVLYKDGFEKHDKLGRQRLGAQLSELVERITDPMVVALDGAWGSGKSHFLKCWVGQHLKGRQNTEVVYFDAFEHDFLDDPLIALTGVIGERLEREDGAAKSALQGLKRAAPALGRGLLRMGVSVATAGVVTRADDLMDAAAGSLEKGAQEAIDSFWQKEDGKRVAMKAFREALVKLTEPVTQDDVTKAVEAGETLTEGQPTRKLIVVVDELDRCRPDYALSLLEIIKHFFNVDGVHFVLGCNMEALAESVRARYGAEYDGKRYLQRFVSVQFRLRNDIGSFVSKERILDYFMAGAKEVGVTTSYYYSATLRYLKHMQFEPDLSIRAVNQLLRGLSLCPATGHDDEYRDALVAGILVLQAFDPNAVSLLRREEGEMWEIVRTLQLPDPMEASTKDLNNFLAWWACLGDLNDDRFKSLLLHDHLQDMANRYDRRLLRHLVEVHLDTFVVP
jgi:hypothetical protein